MNVKAEHYLDYLDKEMSIMGVLSTFCLAVPSLFFERAISADQSSIAHDFLTKLWSNGFCCLMVSSSFMLIGAAFFYKQRSKLAWYYGQISLEMALPNYTGQQLEQWLKNADSWEAWVRYHWAYYSLVLAVLGFILAALAVYIPFMNAFNCFFAFVLLVLFIIMIIRVRDKSTKCKYDNEISFFGTIEFCTYAVKTASFCSLFKDRSVKDSWRRCCCHKRTIRKGDYIFSLMMTAYAGSKRLKFSDYHPKSRSCTLIFVFERVVYTPARRTSISLPPLGI